MKTRILHCVLISLLTSTGISQAQSLDWSDLPDSLYPTKLNQNGPRHTLGAPIYLGATAPDAEVDGQPDATATGDDGASADDEDSVPSATLKAYVGLPYHLAVNCTNLTGTLGRLWVFVDWNRDGDFADANESAMAMVPAGTNHVFVPVSMTVPAGSAVNTSTGLRLRLSTDQSLGPTGPANNGEVEDYMIPIAPPETDWGDLPDAVTGTASGNWASASPPDYRTRAADNGPSHPIRSGLYLQETYSVDGPNPSAATVDGESDGQPDNSANGDDASGESDEYFGIGGHASLRADGPRTKVEVVGTLDTRVTNLTGSTAYLHAFFDLNGDGDFDDADEAQPPLPIPDGTVLANTAPYLPGRTFDYTTPNAALPVDTTVRVRLSTDPVLGPYGPATDGEVVDGHIGRQYIFGFAPDQDWGDLPAPYHTKLADNGPRHGIVSGLQIGSSPPDLELDGVQSATANGDDSADIDDEDALSESNPVLIAGGENRLHVKVKNSTMADATLWGFFDWNHDGDFADANESAPVVVHPAGSEQIVVLHINVPSNTPTLTPAAIRLRLSSEAVLGPDGAAPDGEVEDGFAFVRASGSLVDHGDLPDAAPGTAAGVHGTGAPPDYKTLLSDGGPSHPLIAGLGFANVSDTLDSDFDGEGDGLPDSPFDDGTMHDDESAILQSVNVNAIRRDGVFTEIDATFALDVFPYHATANPATFYMFADVNHNGRFDDSIDGFHSQTFAPNELRDFYGDGIHHVGDVVTAFDATLTNLTPGINQEGTFAVRMRFSSSSTLSADGPAPDGEVEDAVVTFPFTVPADTFDNPDYGDLPAPYPTLHTDNGARHLRSPLIFLGNSQPDGDADGLPAVAADGDDAESADDEDCFNPAAILAIPGSAVIFPIVATNLAVAPAQVTVFADWNGDGDFVDANEIMGAVVPAGSDKATINVNMPVPAEAAVGPPLGVRVRLSSETSAGPTGILPDGEVEDFLIVARTPIDYGDLPAPYATLHADDGARHSVISGLYIGTVAPDLEIDSAPNPAATGDDLTATDDENAMSAATAYADVPFHFAVRATNTTTIDATLKAFIDWNHDGDFADANEEAFVTVPLGTPGANFLLHFTVPNDAITTSPTAVRVRLSRDNIFGPDGLASDGEVEDSFITVLPKQYDWGDLPDVGAGTASGVWGTANPPDYQTLSAHNGPSHVIMPGLSFINSSTGATVDGETNGQPSNDGLGDDTNGVNDEAWEYGAPTPFTAVFDGPRTTFTALPSQLIEWQNLTEAPIHLSWFNDTNNDGDFDDAGEALASGAVPAPETSSHLVLAHTIPFQTPGSTYTYSFAWRYRISTVDGIGPYGPAPDGEVVDEVKTITINIPNFPVDQDWGDLPAPYATTLTNNGPRHGIVPTLRLGNAPDAEINGTPSALANDDDNNGSDDEDSIDTSALNLYPGHPVTLPIRLTNNTGGTAWLTVFIDWDTNGTFDGPLETMFLTVANGITDGVQTFNVTVPETASTSFPVAMRIRLTTDFDVTAPTGPAPDGEVEDHFINVQQPQDFGDLPAPYPTLRTANGPRHIITNVLFMGTLAPDEELDGQPSTLADADELNGGHDEDGFSPAAFHPRAGSTVNLPVIVTNAIGSLCRLHAFVDWNADGDFDDTNERNGVNVNSGAIFANALVPFDVPVNAATTQPVAVRLRLATELTLNPTGIAIGGEVEDYFINVEPPRDFGDLPAPYVTLLENDGPRHTPSADLHLGGTPPDADTDGFPSATANGDDTNATDDEDGFNPATFVSYPGDPYAAFPITFRHMLVGQMAEVSILVDWNADGDFNDVGEVTRHPSISHGFLGDAPLIWLHSVPATAVTGTPLAVRIRLSTETNLPPTGPAPNGEVEDYFITLVQPLDFGDLPTPHKTTLAEDGPRHLISSTMFLGAAQPDVEGDGVHSTTANADDTNGFDDENTLLASYVDAHTGFDLHLQLTATNTTISMAYLQAFADWNADGDFNDANENTEVDVPPGSVNAAFTPKFRVPLSANTTQPVAVRLRLSSLKAYGPIGLAPNGEVEDYFIAPPKEIIDFGDLNDNSSGTAAGVVTNFNTTSQGDYQTRLADGGPRHRARQDLNLNNDTLPLDSTADGSTAHPLPVHVDGEADAHPSANADGDDLDQPSAPNGGVVTPPAFPGGGDEGILITAVLKQTYDPMLKKFYIAIYGNVAVRNQTGSPAYLSAFLDANNDGDFSDADETPLTVGTGTIFGAGPNTHPQLGSQYETPDAIVPSSAASSTAYGFVFVTTYQLPLVDTGIRGWTAKLPLRIRLSTSAGLGPNGINANNSIPDGEVEDYIVSWTTAFDNPYPQTTTTVNQFDPQNWSRIVDKNTSTRLYGSLHFAGHPSQSFNDRWQFDSGVPLTFQEQNPLVPPSLLTYFGLGTVPYLHTVGFGDGGIGSYYGTITIKDLASYRAFMDQSNQTGEDSAPMSDIDGDGIANYYEFAFGSDPALPGSVPKFSPRLISETNNLARDSGNNLALSSGETTHFVLPYLRRTGGTISGVIYTTPDVRYEPQGSTTLNSWDTPMEVPVSLPPDLPAAPSGYEWGAARLTSPITSGSRGFIRLLLGPP